VVAIVTNVVINVRFADISDHFPFIGAGGGPNECRYLMNQILAALANTNIRVTQSQLWHSKSSPDAIQCPLFSNAAYCWHDRRQTRRVINMDEILGWLQSLDRPFAFLVALPFLVVAAAWLGEFIRKQMRRNRHQ